LVIDDPQFAEELFHRIRCHLPDPIADANGARWRPTGLNERFRFCCYEPGEYFKIHRDGVFHRSANQCSRLTFMAYLNSHREFEGGSTRFFSSSDANATPLASILPRAGTLIVFDHSLWHDGERVTRGMKYIMRSDILYELEAPEPDTKTTPTDAHAGYVWSVIELADGSVASGGRDKTIRIWGRSGTSLRCREVLRGHANSITALSSAGADELWSGSRDRSVRVWRRRHGRFCCAVKIDAHAGAVLCLTQLHDGRMASGGADGMVRLWNRHGECVGELGNDASWVWDIKAPNHETLVSASENGVLRLWRLADGKCLAAVKTEGGALRSLAPVRRGEFLASGSANGSICIWRLPKPGEIDPPRVVQRLNGHCADVRALVELPNGCLASGAEDNRIMVWTLATGLVQKTFHHNDFVTALALLREGRLVSASYDGTISIWPEFLTG
jgi:WD40 repeat protein